MTRDHAITLATARARRLGRTQYVTVAGAGSFTVTTESYLTEDSRPVYVAKPERSDYGHAGIAAVKRSGTIGLARGL